MGGPLGNHFLSTITRPRSTPLIIAHRGDSAHAPENTLEAAILGHQSGADAWELDVHLSRDGVPVVLHDESLLRTTDLASRFADDPRVTFGGFVADFDLAELISLDAGSWFLGNGYRSANDFGTFDTLAPELVDRIRAVTVKIPTLRDALDLTKKLDWLVNIELKSFPNREPRLVDAVFRVIAETGTADRILISSFDHNDVALVVERALGVATGVLTETPIHRPDRYVRDIVGSDCYHISKELLGSDSMAYRRHPRTESLQLDRILGLRECGVPLMVYTVNDGLAVHLAEAGVAGIFSDEPGGVLRRLRSLS